VTSALRVGIDVGGTNTDAVLLAGRRVVASAKSPTTPDVTTGIAAAVRRASADADLDAVDAVVIGTTHFINAIAEARRLAPVAAIRLATPPQSLPPLVDWPARLRAAVGGHAFVCRGGAQFDGSELNPLDEPELHRIADRIAGAGVGEIAITGVFSPVNQAAERRAAEILAERLPGASITVSNDIGRIGLLERESAATLNGCLRPLAAQVVDALARVMQGLGVTAPVYLSQNDGTLMNLGFARRFPIFTVASGPTNSMRGAAFLSGIDDCIVVDVGGTTTDVGMLRHGFPRESTVAVSLGGVRTNFRMPDVTSLALGGGSVVHDGGARVGPDSVGYALTDRALVFGGDTLTLTDVAVAAGLAEIGDPSLVSGLSPALVGAALDDVRGRLGEAVDRVKLTAADVPVVLVGGGAVLVDRLAGVQRLVRPHSAGVANAIGAAFAQVGGEVDRVYSLVQSHRDDAMALARTEAVKRAVDAGADPATVSIVDEEDVPLTHLPDGTATRVRVKAIGDLRLDGDSDA
jgi:N-methylhydantoinase A/oxoprolinase/acetone carboxylase beta subunit